MKKILTVLIIVVLCVATVLTAVACTSSELNFGKKLVKTGAMIDILTELTAKTADVGIMDSIMANYYLTINPTYASQLQLVEGLVLAEEEYGIAARKNAKSTIYKVNYALKALNADGTVNEIAAKYGLVDELVIDGNADIGSEPTDADWSEIIADGKIKIGYTVFAPIAYTDTNGKLIGFDTELAEAVAEYYGLTAEFIEIQWDSKTMELESKNIDLIWNGMTITDEIQAACEISIPYLQNRQVAVIRKADADKYTKDTSTMSDAVIAAESGSAGQAVVEK